MEVKAKSGERKLLLELKGELDHHGAKDVMLRLERELDMALPLQLQLVLDFGGVSFMDSSGLAVVLRAQRRMAALGGSVAVQRVPPQPRKVFDAAGISRLVAIRSSEKEEGEK